MKRENSLPIHFNTGRWNDGDMRIQEGQLQAEAALFMDNQSSLGFAKLFQGQTLEVGKKLYDNSVTNTVL